MQAGASVLGISPAAIREWRQLRIALVRLGPAPCAESPLPDAWWSTSPALQAEAIAECRRCPVDVECLAYAIAGRERDGVWGGRTPTQRLVRRSA